MPAEYDDALDLLGPAEDLATHLGAIELLDGIDIVVDKQTDVDNAMQKAVAKAKGVGIFLSLDGWNGVPEESTNALLPLRHSISVWGIDIFRSGAIPLTVALGATVQAIQAFEPAGSRGSMYRWRVGAASFTKAQFEKTKKTVRIYEFPAVYEIVI